MTKSYGSQSMVAPLKRVIVRQPDSTFGNADPKKWHYTERPNLNYALDEHAAFVELVSQSGAEIIMHETSLSDHADAIFTHDPVLVADQGAILLRMGKSLRRGEEEAIGKTLEAAGVPIHARLAGDALAEGGDLLWIDEKTLAVGLGFRTNQAGFDQIQAALPNVSCIPVQLPYFTGPEACLHLMSFISLVDHDCAVVYPSLMP
ncbi:MAG: arginine deiminase family protein, partial [Chloroflexota bacterium]